MRRSGILAIARKDYGEMMNSKQIRVILFLVPTLMVLLIPVAMTVVSFFQPDLGFSSGELDAMLRALPDSMRGPEAILHLLYNAAMSGMFLMVPLMMSTVAAASSFVGEKERHTLETLFFSPNTPRALFLAKALGCFGLSMLVTLLAFAVYAVVATLSGLWITGTSVLDWGFWATVILGLAPALSALGIVFTVRSSSKAENFQEAQQKAAFVVIPVVLLMATQFSGLFLMTWWMALIVSAVVWGIVALLVRTMGGRLDVEKMIR